MASNGKIDTRFLAKKAVEEFSKQHKPKFEKAYQIALDHLANPSRLPYVPKVFIFPYLLAKVTETSLGIARVTYFAFTTLDPDDLTKLAVFPTVYIKRLPRKGVASILAHELAHVIFKGGRVEAAWDYLPKRLLQGFVGMYKAQEANATSAYEVFNEPVKNWLLEWDQRVAQKRDKEILTKGAEYMNYDEVLDNILGPERAQDFIEEQIRKFKEKRRMTNTHRNH